MPQQPRTIRYDGDSPSETHDIFEADARGAEGQDWYPTSQAWTDGALFVVYEHDPDRRLRAAAKEAAAVGPRREFRLGADRGAFGGESRGLTALLIGMIVVAVIGVAMIATSPSDRPANVAALPSTGPVEATSGPPDMRAAPSPAHDASPSPQATPRPTPRPTPSKPTFKDGIWEVGEDIEPGTYRTLGAEGCYWSRLRRLTGRNRDVIVDENAVGPAVVTVKRGDVGFESARCRTWTADLGRITESRIEFGEGTYLVGVDMTAGTYRSRGRTPCHWARLRGFTGEESDIIDNGIVSGRRTVTIRASDKGFSSAGCGTWTRASR